YPEDKYPQGHPHLAQSLSNLGFLIRAQGEDGKALGYNQQALEMAHAQIRLFAESASEAEVFNLLASLAKHRNAFLANSRQVFIDPAKSYSALFWQDKAGPGNILRSGRLSPRGLADEPPRTHPQCLLDTRRQLARLLLAPADPLHAKE